MPLEVPPVTDPGPGPWPEIVSIVRRALLEDVGHGDVTTLALVPGEAVSSAVVLARKQCVVAGTDVAKEVFRQVDPSVSLTTIVRDGQVVEPGATVLSIRGPACAILTAERTALNILQRLSGIATLTRRFVDAIRPMKTAILDTRKTTPGLRILEKYAVKCGGGVNHRMGLHDMVLIKDNHRRFWEQGATIRLDQAVMAARRRWPGLRVEIEVETLEELDNVLPARPDWVLLDNMSLERMRLCVAKCRGNCSTEASGGITLETVADVARTGVDAISIGALTHSAPAVDLSLELDDHEHPPG